MSSLSSTIPHRIPTWPRSARLALEAIVTVTANAYLAARSRAAGSPSKPTVVTAHDAQPTFDVSRTKYQGDPQLPVFRVDVEWPEAAGTDWEVIVFFPAHVI